MILQLSSEIAAEGSHHAERAAGAEGQELLKLATETEEACFRL